MKMLIIDDNLEITDVINYYRQSQNIDCDITNDGKSGLTKIRHYNYDLVLLDIAMPEFTGLDVVNNLNNDGLLEKKNVVVLTASSDHKLFEEMKSKGVREIFQKPCSVDEIISSHVKDTSDDLVRASARLTSVEEKNAGIY